jgi:hypothetical protein
LKQQHHSNQGFFQHLILPTKEMHRRLRSYHSH